MPELPNYTIFPISDSALTVDFGNVINEDINARVLSLFHLINSAPIPGMIEAVTAYSSLTLYYDVFLLRKQLKDPQTVYDWVAGKIKEVLSAPLADRAVAGKEITVPVCYNSAFAPDMEAVARQSKRTIEQIIQIHTERKYRVYMLGFLPGFSYLGELDERIAIPRKTQPSTVLEGSIGLAGRQTGIYPTTCPGGWHIIGRTPLKLFSITNKDGGIEKGIDCLLHAGDHVRFISITPHEFENY